MVRTTYSSNNSGGSWWLKDEDWKALEAAGWEVEWYANMSPDDVLSGLMRADSNGRWLGALASRAHREGIGFREAISEWASITGEDPRALGCHCCGAPHSFSSNQGDDYYPTAQYGQDW